MAERTLPDDLGYAVPLGDGAPARIVSLVPSITEALATTCPDRLVGATDWCTHPADLDARGVARVRGTKNPDLTAIADLAPDLVLANREENRELDARRLRERGIPVWVTDINTVPGAIASLRRVFGEVLRLGEPDWLAAAALEWAGDVPEPTLRVATPIWRDPWMAVGTPTYTADLLARLGWANPFAGQESRYPHVDLARLDDPEHVDLVLLPDEPYVFTADDGPEAFSQVPVAHVSGRRITWYGPAMVGARAEILAASGAG